MEDPRARWPRVPDPSSRLWRGRLASGTTVSPRTAARVLGLAPDQALDLAAHGMFPCKVITTSDGYRVPFGALVDHLRDRLRSRAGGDG